jgi:hypothetical protein
VSGVGGVPVAVVYVVGVVLVRDGHVSAVRRMLVPVLGVLGVLGGGALVRMALVDAVHVPVVGVVDVVTVREGDVAAAFAVRVRVVGVRAVLGGDRHLTLSLLLFVRRRPHPRVDVRGGFIQRYINIWQSSHAGI